MFSRVERAAADAWEAWRAGDIEAARSRATEVLSRGASVDEARHILALAAHVQGDHAAAITTYHAIGRRYGRLSELDDPILWSHVRLGNIEAARAFAEGRGLLKSKAAREQLRLALEKPLSVESSGVMDIPFTDDEFTPLMPGVAIQLNGQSLVARLDTGGSFVHLSRRCAQALGIAHAGRERGFAALVRESVSYGIADLDLGGGRIRNVPVHVHADDTLPVETIGRVFGAKIDLIIGTNLFARFLTTIDVPGRRLVLSGRGDARARIAHLACLSGRVHRVPFIVLGSHLMIAPGRVGDRPMNFFIDSGLAAFNHEQGQAGLLLPRRTLESWSVRQPPGGRFAEIPWSVALGSAERCGLTAFVVGDGTWRRLADWSHLDVTALLSHAYFKRYTWTLDFDSQIYWLHEAAPENAM
jgi:hypothetical protein